MNKIKSGDRVIVIAGKDKGRTGIVTGFDGDDRVMVEGVNVARKHTKPNPNAMPPVPGGIVDKEMPLHRSNVMLLNPETNKGDRVGIRTQDDGKRVRFFKSNDKLVDA